MIDDFLIIKKVIINFGKIDNESLE